MSNTIKCHFLDTARHEYVKVSIFDLNRLGVIPLISDYSFLGIDEDNYDLNEYHSAYIEGDCDWDIVMKAAEFHGKTLDYDHETLQKKYDEEYASDYRSWMENLAEFNEHNIEEVWQIEITQPSEELESFLNKKEEESEDADHDDVVVS